MTEILGVEVRCSFPLPAETFLGTLEALGLLLLAHGPHFGSWYHPQGSQLLLRWSNQNLGSLRVTLGRETFGAINQRRQTLLLVSPLSRLTPMGQGPPLTPYYPPPMDSILHPH